MRNHKDSEIHDFRPKVVDSLNDWGQIHGRDIPHPPPFVAHSRPRLPLSLGVGFLDQLKISGPYITKSDSRRMEGADRLRRYQPQPGGKPSGAGWSGNPTRCCSTQAFTTGPSPSNQRWRAWTENQPKLL